ncbi:MULTISPECIES: restriction endonuclease subunit S [Acinetobacter]|uniref:restriction endonuclease subunit S n=1 Tax=Acinetobacter TaxID=469 RepID=UPI000450BF39|nr:MULTISPECIES: restriction endonuclease subunit S [Acinetobacter]EXE98999.1 type I restriction modification DNA specificity domain protein [Acinetobacter sp. 259052]EYT20616.1 type I restriction modification DNA specificity domain protein [Acinetobacter sp. 1592897]MDF0626982.1 restriction endonuclease subunit S [Acinetobacter nosocomialis]
MEKQKCPSVRFKIFNDAWGEKNLANEVSFYSGLTYSPNDITNKSGTLVLRSSNVQNGEISLLDNVYVRPEVAYSQNVDIGDIIVVVRNGSRSLIGKHAIIKKNMINTVIGAFMTGVKSSQPDFINALFDSNNFINQVNRNLGATINQITIGAFKEMSFNFPTVEEQTQIGNFFKNLDQSIALHEKKLTQTQNLKKAMLEKMFPKAGSKQPEIRLKGFSGEWQLDAIGNVLQEVFRPINLDNETKYRLVTVKRRNGGIAERAVLKGKDILVKSQFEVKAGDYVISKRQVVHGATGLVPHELDGSIVSNEYLVGQSTDKLNIEFFALLSTLPEMYKKFFLSSYGVDIEKLFFDVNDWKKREILLPSLAEQIQIAVFFKQLDETLALQQQQLQTLKNLKQAFLEKMFV